MSDKSCRPGYPELEKPSINFVELRELIPLSTEELKTIAAMTVKLTEIRQRGCPHLSVEEVAPQIMKNLIRMLFNEKNGISDLD